MSARKFDVPAVTSPLREQKVKYRPPHGTDWEELDLDTATDMTADRVLASRDKGLQWEVDGLRTRRTRGFASLGGATLDNEENDPDEEALHRPLRAQDAETTATS